jgi:hypothetical protein
VGSRLDPPDSICSGTADILASGSVVDRAGVGHPASATGVTARHSESLRPAPPPQPGHVRSAAPTRSGLSHPGHASPCRQPDAETRFLLPGWPPSRPGSAASIHSLINQFGLPILSACDAAKAAALHQSASRSELPSAGLAHRCRVHRTHASARRRHHRDLPTDHGRGRLSGRTRMMRRRTRRDTLPSTPQTWTSIFHDRPVSRDAGLPFESVVRVAWRHSPHGPANQDARYAASRAARLMVDYHVGAAAEPPSNRSMPFTAPPRGRRCGAWAWHSLNRARRSSGPTSTG